MSSTSAFTPITSATSVNTAMAQPIQEPQVRDAALAQHIQKPQVSNATIKPAARSAAVTSSTNDLTNNTGQTYASNESLLPPLTGESHKNTPVTSTPAPRKGRKLRKYVKRQKTSGKNISPLISLPELPLTNLTKKGESDPLTNITKKGESDLGLSPIQKMKPLPPGPKSSKITAMMKRAALTSHKSFTQDPVYDFDTGNSNLCSPAQVKLVCLIINPLNPTDCLR